MGYIESYPSVELGEIRPSELLGPEIYNTGAWIVCRGAIFPDIDAGTRANTMHNTFRFENDVDLSAFSTTLLS